MARVWLCGVLGFVLAVMPWAGAQQPGQIAAAASVPVAGVLKPDELVKVLPATVFFRGLSAPIQARNASGARFEDQRLMLVMLVDTSGYSTSVQEKYQAYLLTETPLLIEGKRLPPGAYGCGFIAGMCLWCRTWGQTIC